MGRFQSEVSSKPIELGSPRIHLSSFIQVVQSGPTKGVIKSREQVRDVAATWLGGVGHHSRCVEIQNFVTQVSRQELKEC